MTDPMHDLLERASADVPVPDLAAAALAGAHRRRAQRRIGLAAAASVAVIVAAAGVVTDQTVDADRSPVDGPTPPAPTEPVHPDEVESVEDGEPVTNAIVSAAWDPREVGSLTWRDSFLPRTLQPVDAVPLSANPVAEAVLAVDDRSAPEATVHVLGADGVWRFVDDPGLTSEGLDGYVELVSRHSISPDGTQLLVRTGTHGLLVIDLPTGESRLLTIDVSYFGTFGWAAGGYSIVVGELGGGAPAASGGGLLIDPRTGAVETIPHSLWQWDVTPDGTYIEFQYTETGGQMQTYRGLDSMTVVRRTDQLGALTSPSAGSLYVAAVRAVGGWNVPRQRTDYGGILVLSTGGDPVSMLPVRPQHPVYEHRMRTLGWVDEETLLVRTPEGTPRGEPQTGPEQIVAWNMLTGEITRVAEVPIELEIALSPRYVE